MAQTKLKEEVLEAVKADWELVADMARASGINIGTMRNLMYNKEKRGSSAHLSRLDVINLVAKKVGKKVSEITETV
jgi:hypothetical protein